MQADVLDRRQDNGQATVLGREDIDLIGALAHIALRDFQLRWWSECADALRPGMHKTSACALPPRPDFSPPPR
jgi:hypothetical protein